MFKDLKEIMNIMREKIGNLIIEVDKRANSRKENIYYLEWITNSMVWVAD